MSKPTAVIFDVDGTLCNVESARPFLNHTTTGGRNFHAFHREAMQCPPHPWVVAETHAARAAGHVPIVVTAREGIWYTQTLWWLLLNDVAFDWLFMRNIKDYRKDFIIKEEILRRIQVRYNVIHAFDDNPQVLALWEREGIPTTIVPGWVEEGL